VNVDEKLHSYYPQFRTSWAWCILKQMFEGKSCSYLYYFRHTF